jgi:Fur family transcriptional regulator, ferric uptake regulator
MSSPKVTRHRERILAELRVLDTFASAQDLYLHLRACGSPISLSTVYRTLHLLDRQGHVDVVGEPGGERRYRARPDPRHRHYLICRHCGHSIAVDTTTIEDWAAALPEHTGFADIAHTVELTGTCRRCAAGSGDGAGQPQPRYW